VVVTARVVGLDLLQLAASPVSREAPLCPEADMSLPTLTLLAALLLPQDVDKLLKSKDPDERLKGITQLIEEGPAKADALLEKAVEDKDFEVALLAVQACATHGSDELVEMLIDLCIDHAVEEIRDAAATSLSLLDADAASRILEKKLKGKDAERATRALGRVAGRASEKLYLEFAESADPGKRRAGWRALAGLKDDKYIELLRAGIGHDDVLVSIGALEALSLFPQEAAAGTLLDAHQSADLAEVVGRRIRGYLGDWLARRTAAERSGIVSGWAEARLDDARPDAERRFLLLIEALTRGEEPVLDPSTAVAWMEEGLAHQAKEVRATAARALGRFPKGSAAEALAGRAIDDAIPAVRFQALTALSRQESPAAIALLEKALNDDKDAAIREQAAVLLGRHFPHEGLATLRAALQDGHWTVQLAAAVVLGRAQDEVSLEALVALRGAEDWRVRGAAVMGLGWMARAACVEPLIDALEDTDPVVVATAHDFLEKCTGGEVEPEAWRWRKWWKSRADEFRFLDNGTTIKRDHRYGRRDEFRRSPYASFQQQDVIVLSQGRDRLEEILERMKVPFTTTVTGEVPQSGLHPRAVFLANCPGETDPVDQQHLEWFVRAGGHLFGSCWSLTRTIAKTFPGFIEAHPQARKEPGFVPVFPASSAGEAIDGVFEPSSRPLFRLAGYQLIDVLDPLRCDVLVDSPEALRDFGSGTLAATFEVGHGMVLSSTNHFALPGMHGLKFKTEEERKAYALQRLGFSFEQVRELAEEGVFKRDKTAEERCEDLTILRLVSRFIYLSRAAGR
jgi:HEAT repeat protein